MSLVINTNSIATAAANYLEVNQANLQRSLTRLASGSKIVTPSDDPGGLAVGMKLAATLNRNTRTQQNVQNAISFLQVQDGALTQVTKILDRMSELKTMHLDVTKNSSDLLNYDAEFNQLQDQLTNIRDEKFNSISLFQQTAALATASPLKVWTTEQGDTTNSPAMTISTHTIFDTTDDGTGVGLELNAGVDLTDKSAAASDSLGDFTVDNIGTFIQNAASARANNGAEMSRMQASLAMLTTNHANIEAAHSRLVDVDMAVESTHYAKHNILVQSSAAMLAQANSVPNIALQLLG
jgi:flagellin